ncbi:hypothetical protein [Micromonospora luteifusca]|uniref:Deoxyribose-phosphate aldolase n=1 Tax=Micromonospora luteifusca TaxID=709860 RepID=A0ABS2M2X1_9ACTN|nr:hypothetical protein [Micromonospora luteifusca]MBM7494239.1 deoxyribose-phosphate aldolase [Micromonospora luteifusca]
MSSSSSTHLWILVVGLSSLVVALITAMLKTSTGSSAAEATMAAGAAFATAFGLGLGILGTL